MSIQTPYSEERRARPVVFPVLLIILGGTLLALNLGYLSWESARAALQYWPVIFILLGVEALITRRSPWGALLLALLAVAIFSSNGWAHMAPWRWQQPPAERPMAVQNQVLNGANRAAVNLTAGGAQVNVGALHEGGVLARWQGVEGDLPSYRVRDGVGRLDLDLTRGRGFPGMWRMNPFTASTSTPEASQLWVQLATDIPMDLELHIGASEATLDLRELQVDRLTLDAGASNGTIYLPSIAESGAVTIRGGASNLEIVVPDGVRARITSEGGLSSLRVDPDRFSPVGDSTTTFQSRLTDPAAHTLNVTLRLGASSVNVR